MTRDAKDAAEGQVFKPRCHVDAIAENIAVVFDDVADMDAESKFDSLVNRHSGVSANHAVLDSDGAAHGCHRACKFDHHSVAGGLDDMAAMLLDAAVGEVPAMRLQLGKGAFLIGTHQPTVSRDISRENRHKSPVDPLFGQAFHPAVRRATV